MSEQRFNPIIATWIELRELIDILEFDVVKNAKGFASAGVRARHGLRKLKWIVADLVMLTIEIDKEIKAKKRATRKQSVQKIQDTTSTRQIIKEKLRNQEKMRK